MAMQNGDRVYVNFVGYSECCDYKTMCDDKLLCKLENDNNDTCKNTYDPQKSEKCPHGETCVQLAEAGAYMPGQRSENRTPVAVMSQTKTVACKILLIYGSINPAHQKPVMMI